MKLVINMMVGSVMCSFAEGMALADKSGLSQNTLLDILNLGSIANPLISGKGKGETELGSASQTKTNIF